MRRSLLAALESCAERPRKTAARRFLDGLSGDELAFLAEMLGACILEGRCCRSAEELSAEIEFQPARRSDDLELKLILLREYLGCSGFHDGAWA